MRQIEDLLIEDDIEREWEALLKTMDEHRFCTKIVRHYLDTKSPGLPGPGFVERSENGLHRSRRSGAEQRA